MKCPHCGAEITASNAAFCSECGRQLTTAPSAPPQISHPKRQSQRSAFASRHYEWAVVVALVLVLFIGGMIGFTAYFDLTLEDWHSLFKQGDDARGKTSSVYGISPEHDAITAPAPTQTHDDMTGTAPVSKNEDKGDTYAPAVFDTEEQEPEVMVTLPGGTKAPESDFIFPYSGSQTLTIADLDSAFAGLNSADAALRSQQALNEIYARYGYRFHPELSDSARWASQYFGALAWYNDIVHDSWSNTGEVPINRTESANIDLIAGWQADHGYR